MPCDICEKKDCYKLTLTENNIFEYAWGGVYINKDETLPPDTKSMCYDCMEKYIFEEYKTIECSVCYKKFQNMSMTYECEDGVNCACTIYEESIACGFGSSGYDGCCIGYCDKRPTHLKLNTNICDTCLGELIKNNICRVKWGPPA